MVDITPLIRSDRKIIQNYQGGRFLVSNEPFDTPVIITPDAVQSWQVESFSDLKTEDFRPLEGLGIGILLLGGGSTAQFLQPALRQYLRDIGIVVELMDTGAACRTYNVLMAEGRPVAAAMFPYT